MENPNEPHDAAMPSFSLQISSMSSLMERVRRIERTTRSWLRIDCTDRLRASPTPSDLTAAVASDTNLSRSSKTEDTAFVRQPENFEDE